MRRTDGVERGEEGCGQRIVADGRRRGAAGAARLCVCGHMLATWRPGEPGTVWRCLVERREEHRATNVSLSQVVCDDTAYITMLFTRTQNGVTFSSAHAETQTATHAPRPHTSHGVRHENANTSPSVKVTQTRHTIHAHTGHRVRTRAAHSGGHEFKERRARHRYTATTFEE